MVMAEGNESPRDPGYEPGELLRINLDFFQLAAATGGDFYFWAPGEFGTVDFPLSTASEPILLAYGKNGGPPARMKIPVDSAITGYQLFIGAQRLDEARLFRPDGTLAVDGASGLRVRRFRHMLIVSAVGPEPGIWSIEMTGAGAFNVSVRYLSERSKLEKRGVSELDLLDFDFVQLRGRPGHEGYFPLKGDPMAGSEQICSLEMSGAGYLQTVEFVGEGGKSLMSFNMDVPGPDDEPLHFDDERFFPCRVPEVPFRIKAEGTDLEGNDFLRMTPGLVAPGKRK